MDEMCLEMCKITRWERGYRLILDRVDFSVHKKEKVLIRGKIQEDTRQMFQVASGVTAVQEGTYRISRAGIIPEQFPDLERMRAIDYLLLPLLTQGYNRKQAWGRIKPMVKTSTLWKKREAQIKTTLPPLRASKWLYNQSALRYLKQLNTSSFSKERKAALLQYRRISP